MTESLIENNDQLSVVLKLNVLCNVRLRVRLFDCQRLLPHNVTISLRTIYSHLNSLFTIQYYKV